MEKYNELIKNTLKYFAELGIWLFPGLCVLDIVFQQGFFHNKITSWIDLFFVIFWSLIISLPFHYRQPKRFYRLVKYMMKRSKSNKEIDLEMLSNEVELGFVILKIIIFYFTYKLLIWQEIFVFDYLIGINAKIIFFLISILIAFVSGYILICPFQKNFIIKKKAE